MNSTNIKPTYWVGGILFDKDEKLILVKNKQGIWSLPGGTPTEGEIPINTFIREFIEETRTRIFAWQIKKQALWVGTAKDLGFPIKEGNRPKIYTIFFSKNTINNFSSREINTDEDIIETRSFDLNYVLRYMLESKHPGRHTRFHNAHALILKKLRPELQHIKKVAA